MCSSDFTSQRRRGKQAQQISVKRASVWLSAAAFAWLAFSCVPACVADTFVKPTDQELKMTSLPGYPGAPAVILFREEITKDDLHTIDRYDRVKILTEEGKKYANVELGFVSRSSLELGFADDMMVSDIVGRTIHADGTIVPFTGKPYLKVLEKVGGIKVQEKVFTLPEVEVGSIIEYRYATRYNDEVYESPTWMIQDDLYVKQAHFMWYPTARELTSEDDKPINAISWFPILPEGAKIERHDLLAGGSLGGSKQVFELNIKDVPPKTNEEYMPPIGSFSYRVRFNFTPYRTNQEYWAAEGKRWSKRVNSFTSPNKDLTEATQKDIAGATSPDAKLRQIYATVMRLENTKFTRDRETREDKAAGMGKLNNAGDVLAHERGTPTQLAELFLAMAKAAGFQAYAMEVPDRSQELFTPEWMSFQQFDDMVAIVVVDGKEQFFDPGSRYCPYGQLAWQHTFTKGLRQTEGGGSEISQTAGEGYKANRTNRVANLTMDPHGEITGKVDLTMTGAPALHWRQTALGGDEESLHKGLRESMEQMLPKSLRVEVAEVKDLTEYDKPLIVSYQVKGTLGNATGKRVMLPSDIFVANAPATFPHEKRETAVDFHYPRVVQDATRVNLPPDLAVEAVPNSAKLTMQNEAAYVMNITAAPTNVVTRRDFVFADVIVLVKDYPNLRTFYSQFESKDQESIVLKAGPATTASAAQPQGN